MAQSGKIWLVKSSTRILGPFNLEGIHQLLINKQISVIDEVRTPEGRWTYIRENKSFKDIVDIVRSELSKLSEDTMTQSITHQTYTKTDVLVEPTTSVDDELTPIPSPHRPVGNFDSSIKDVTSRTKPNYDSGTPVQSYGVGNQEFQSRVQKKSQTIKWALLGLVLLIAGGGFYLNSNKTKKPVGKSYSEHVLAARKYRSLGLYEKSLENFKVAMSIKPLSSEDEALMAPMSIQIEKQTVSGRRVLEKYLMSRDVSRAELTEINLSIALSFMFERDYVSAEKVLQKILASDPHNKFLSLNLAAMALEKRQYAKAYSMFKALQERHRDFKEALVGKVISALSFKEIANDGYSFGLFIQEIDRALDVSPYLRHELLVLRAALATELDGVNAVQKSINLFLGSLPVLSNKYFPSLFGFSGYYGWDKLELLCNTIFSKSSQYAEIKAFLSQCLKHSNKDIESANFLRESYKESPKSPYVLLTVANDYINQNRSPEAFSILKQPELSNLASKDILMGTVCLQTQDVMCAKSAFNSAYRKNSRNIYSIYGMAWVASKENNKGLAYQLIGEGFQVVPNFIPLVELRDQLESK